MSDTARTQAEAYRKHRLREQDRAIVEADFIHSEPEKKPHGRIAYTLHRSGGRRDYGADYIDLSIMPRQPKRRR